MFGFLLHLMKENATLIGCLQSSRFSKAIKDRTVFMSLTFGGSWDTSFRRNLLDMSHGMICNATNVAEKIDVCKMSFVSNFERNFVTAACCYYQEILKFPSSFTRLC